MVEIEQSAQTLPPLHVGGQAHRRWRSLQELVVESLVGSLAMVVVDVLAHAETHVPFAEGDDATETFPFIERTNRSAYALRLGLFGGRRIG